MKCYLVTYLNHQDRKQIHVTAANITGAITAAVKYSKKQHFSTREVVEVEALFAVEATDK